LAGGDAYCHGHGLTRCVEQGGVHGVDLVDPTSTLGPAPGATRWRATPRGRPGDTRAQTWDELGTPRRYAEGGTRRSPAQRGRRAEGSRWCDAASKHKATQASRGARAAREGKPRCRIFTFPNASSSRENPYPFNAILARLAKCKKKVTRPYSPSPFFLEA
jgi:hypothetical protein